MSHSFLNQAMGMSIGFMGIMVTIMIAGISFFGNRKIKKNRKKDLTWMSLLIVLWGIFVFFETLLKEFFVGDISSKLYQTPCFYNLIFGFVVYLIWVFGCKKCSNGFKKIPMIFAGIFATLGLGGRVVFGFCEEGMFFILNSIFVVIPLIIGFFMAMDLIIKNEKR